MGCVLVVFVNLLVFVAVGHVLVVIVDLLVVVAVGLVLAVIVDLLMVVAVGLVVGAVLGSQVGARVVIVRGVVDSHGSVLKSMLREMRMGAGFVFDSGWSVVLERIASGMLSLAVRLRLHQSLE